MLKFLLSNFNSKISKLDSIKEFFRDWSKIVDNICENNFGLKSF